MLQFQGVNKNSMSQGSVWWLVLILLAWFLDHVGSNLISWFMLNDDYRQQTIKLFPKLPNIRNRPSYHHSYTHQDHLASSQKLVGGSMLRLFPWFGFFYPSPEKSWFDAHFHGVSPRLCAYFSARCFKDCQVFFTGFGFLLIFLPWPKQRWFDYVIPGGETTKVETCGNLSKKQNKLSTSDLGKIFRTIWASLYFSIACFCCDQITSEDRVGYWK